MGDDVATLLGPTPTPRAKYEPLAEPWLVRHRGHRVVAVQLVGVKRHRCLDCQATHYVVAGGEGRDDVRGA